MIIRLTPPVRFSVQSDIYAFGMFLYEVLTHHFPFEKYVTESPDGSELPVSKQHWSIAEVHKKGAGEGNEALVKRWGSKATTILSFPEEIKAASPSRYVELLKSCIAVRWPLYY